MSADIEGKAIAAGAQLQQALESAADAFKIIASSIPSLLPQNGQASFLFSGSQMATSAETTSTPHKRKRKEKDPDAPEKPVSAYHLWSKENKDRIKASLPGDPSASEVVAELNRLWKELAEVLKKPFQETADKDKARYKQEMTAYEQSNKGSGSDGNPVASVSQPHPSSFRELTRAKGGFTAVKAAPLSLNPEIESESEHDSEDEAVLAADLGGSQPTEVPESKRHKKEGGGKHKDSKEKSKGKDKDKERHKDKKKRRKSEKVDA